MSQDQSTLQPVAQLDHVVAATARVPLATYRLQFNSAFRFQDAEQFISYLDQLGVSDIYASPYFQARPESTHGYDIADHNSLNPAIGNDHDYNRLVDTLHRHGMSQILDFVPNHMGIGEPTNTWWVDVLENGPSSVYAQFFDIDWHPIKRELENKVLLPILGSQYGRVLENGELRLRYEDGSFFLNYWENELPVNPRTYIDVLEDPLDYLTEELGEEHPDLLEYQSIITALTNMPARTETDRNRVLERRREKEIIKRRLAALTTENDVIREAVEHTVTLFNGTVGDPRSFDMLDELINRQAYRLAYWRVAAEEINYRRFFDINDLAAIKMERPDVFDATHQLVFDLLARGAITGLRLDHTDGLWDPVGYFCRLQERYAEVKGLPLPGHAFQPELLEARFDTRLRASERPLYVVAEKILGHGEKLPEDWAIQGTTGYDFMTAVNSVFVDSASEKAFNDIYSSFIDQRINFDELIYRSKKTIMSTALASELNVLAESLAQIAEHNRYYRDFTLFNLRQALHEVIACFPVYRTYTVAENDTVSERDKNVIDRAIAHAKRRDPTADPSVYDFLGNILRLHYPDTSDPEARQEQRTFVMKFQQCTGPVMAKGLEDTAFYIYNRLSSLNEVGGEPDHFGISVAAFHRQNQERLRTWPDAMLSTSTHDTKRSEDVRARINVLSELPREWRVAINRWSRLNRRKKTTVDGILAPDRNEEYLLYQTLLGTWPFYPMNAEEKQEYIARIQEYMVKAIREAKVHTSWFNPNTAYDDAVKVFVAAVLNDARFVNQIQVLHAKVAHYGAFNALGQTLLKLTSPGVPDIYQGTEMWDLSLVDPDNRRPVDFHLRKWLLGELIDSPTPRPELAQTLTETKHEGRIKLYMIHRVLQFRKQHGALFRRGSYLTVQASAAAADNVIAFGRTLDDKQIVVVTPRLLAKRLGEPAASPLGESAWGDATLNLPGGITARRFRNLFTDEVLTIAEGEAPQLALAEVFKSFPVALLVAEAAPATAKPKQRAVQNGR